jgi:hypothetical protein
MKCAALFVTALAVAVGLRAAPTAAQPPAQAGGAPPSKPGENSPRSWAAGNAETLGLQSNGNLLQVFASEATGTWTLVTMHPSGTACLIGAGDSWEISPKPNADPEA